MKIYDDGKIAEIEMYAENPSISDEEISENFFRADELEYCDDLDAYRVEDVDDALNRALNWKDDGGVRESNRDVWYIMENLVY